VNPQPLGTAKISGTVFADFDYTNNDPEVTWDRVANTKVIAKIHNHDNNTDRYVETMTNGNGEYTIEVEISDRAFDAELTVVDFKASVKYDGGSKTEVFFGEWFDLAQASLLKGGEYVRDIYYNP